ncbi:type VI secretion system protein TssL, long form [Caballeronia sp. SBC1]|uniref:type VI secretion system protein TssL, long form n=1 Tax=Caballeronia sp. SBC1 TaxID=2705548 RepID=UPI001F14E92E|nr:type VI secretion system protein TssL, long form [Caballeronia sp. SBC1]
MSESLELPAPENPAQRLVAIRVAQNPLLEASRVLLRALADMPDTLESQSAVEALRVALEQEVRIFQSLCEQANIRRDHMLGARYCLCTALDEAAMQTTWASDGKSSLGKWNTDGLATTFHEDRNGGDKVYYLIGRLMTEPKEHLDLLEVIYRVLSLGFEGRYRHITDGRRQHDAVRQRLYTEIMSQRGPVPVPLSPHWQGDTSGHSRPFYDFPVWISVVVLSVILLGFYGYAKYELMTRSAAIERKIAEIGHMTPPPAPPTLHLTELLKNEIAAGKVSVDEDEHHSAVTFHGDDMFVAGNASINPSMQPLVAKIAAEIIKVPGKVTVIGHTDNTPIRGRAFTSNQALSEERATQVMQLLQNAGVPASRLEAIGKGDTAPIADDKTFQGRAQNRRVEINVAE